MKKLLKVIIPVIMVGSAAIGTQESSAINIPVPPTTVTIPVETTETVTVTQPVVKETFELSTTTLMPATTAPLVVITKPDPPTTIYIPSTTVAVATTVAPTLELPTEPVVTPYDVMLQTLTLLQGTDRWIPTWDCIARNESGRRQVLISVTSDYGFLQINSWWWRLGGFHNLAASGWITWETYDFLMQADRFDPVFQAWAADAIWRSSGNSWRQWSVHRNCGV